MSTLQLRIMRQRARQKQRRRQAERRGSTLLIVLVLMTMLASLGVIFYVFAAQERASANYYSDGAKVKQFDIDRDTLFDFGIRQLIEGPRPGTFRNSALSGRRHTLLGNMLGLDTTGGKFDFAPYNGRQWPRTNWVINDGGSANPTGTGVDIPSRFLAGHDPDYTYPDTSNVFLSYMGYDPMQGRRVIIPSFHRPQIPALRGTASWYNSTFSEDLDVDGNLDPSEDTNNNGVLDSGEDANGNGVLDLAEDTNNNGVLDTVCWQHILRPHERQIYIAPSGQQQPPAPGVSRYLNAGQIAALGGSWTGWGTFPFTPQKDTDGDGNFGEQGVWSLSSAAIAGSALPANADNYEWDVDNDGDGVNEGVWLDVDFPPLENSAGMLYVPFVSFTVVDADGLLNLNAHGNMARVWNSEVDLDRSPFRAADTQNINDRMISRSNQGLYPTEVNPLWALNRRPPASGGSFNANRYDGVYGADPFFSGHVMNPVPENWIEAANRDWLYLLMGRYTPSPADLVPGRWGEEHLLYRAIINGSTLQPVFFATDGTNVLNDPWPGPGQTKIDDNGDTNKVTGDWFGSTYQAFGKPLDYSGLGSYWASASPKLGDYPTPGVGGPARWPRFTRYSSAPSNPVQWPNSGLQFTQSNGLYNDAGEMVLDSDFRKDEDGLFGVEEMRALFLSSADFAIATGGESRITQLAPFNFDATQATFGSGNNARNTQEFRSKFTTRSWDRKQHSIGTNSARTWEFSTHQINGSGQVRRSANSATNPTFFPPQYGTGLPYTTNDLFRPVLRTLIEVQANNFDQPKYQLRLNLNQLLVGPNGNPSPSFQHPSSSTTAPLPPNIQLQYRPLTPHPDQTTLTAAPITAVAYPAGGNFGGSANNQEYWARRDRQLLARDIFALLYVLAWPDGIDPTASGFNATPYRPMIRQFAQYAVNLVDAIDRDNIITRFEYDINVNDGWEMNDDPYLTGADPITGISDDTGDRFEVFGVERLDLTLSEAAAVRAESGASNLTYTEWDDTVTDHQHFSYVELRNPGPNNVSFTNRAWRVEVGPNYADQSLFTMPTDPETVRRLTLRGDSVDAGDIFTIGSTDNASGGMHPSIMKVSTSGAAPGSGWDADQTTWIMPAQKELRLDLKDSTQTTNYSLTNAAGTAVATAALYDNQVFAKIRDAATPLYFRLYRRLSPDRPFPGTTAEEQDNPFVLVDEIAIDDGTITSPSTTAATGTRGVVTFATGDMSADITAKLANLRSRQKGQPFSTHSTNGYLFTNPTGAYGNTLAANNSNSPAAFTNWQKVFDRDLASPGEMLHVTLGGFSDIDTLRNSSISTARALLPTFGASQDVNASGNYLVLNGDTTTNNATEATIPTDAEILFRPTVTPTGAALTPRWHRLLEIVEVSSKMQATIPGFPNPVDYPRVAGKINVNTMRHPETAAGLIDDPSIMSFRVDEDTNGNGMFEPGEDTNGNNNLDLLTPPRLQRTDNTGVTNEDWWQALVASRDGRRQNEMAFPDSTTGLYLPGTTESKPFRSFGQSLGGANDYLGVENTLLRSWPGDNYPNASNDTDRPRQLLELGLLNEHRGTAGFTTLDPYVRSRILNKVMNNVTTRSNVFVVFMSVKFFRANRNSTNGAVQIGGPLMPPSAGAARWEPEYRRFYVVDRSQLEKAFDPQTGNFNFRALIEFQQDLN